MTWDRNGQDNVKFFNLEFLYSVLPGVLAAGMEDDANFVRGRAGFIDGICD